MARIGLGIETDAPKNYQSKLNNREKKLAEAVREDQNIVDDFQQAIIAGNTDNADGTAYTGAAGEELGFSSGKHAYEMHIGSVATGALVCAPWKSASGLEITSYAGGTGPETVEITNGITADSKAAYVVGSFVGGKSVYFEANFNIDDISSVLELAVGFRIVEAYQAAVNSYNTYATFNIGGAADGRIDIETELNGAGLATTDTTEPDVADGEAIRLRVEVANDGTCKFKLSQTAADSDAAALLDLAEPAVTANFTFDSGDTIVPFVFYDTETSDPGLSCGKWEVGYM